MKSIKDKFGNEIHINDYVFFSRHVTEDVSGRHGVIFKGKVTKINKKSCDIDDKYSNVHIDCIAKDNSRSSVKIII